MNYKEAENLLEEGKPASCEKFFRQNGYTLEYAYSLLLQGKYKEAQTIIYPIDSIRADWIKKLIPMINGILDREPTYFQIRNFLEIDLTLLIKSGRFQEVNNLLKYSELFQGINNETYKLLGRGLLKNNYIKEAKVFLDRSLNEYYNDVELHYLFAEYYMATGREDYVKKAVENCLKINPEYYPAKKKYAELTK